jgi:glycerol-3-phosphate dehydrogenase
VRRNTSLSAARRAAELDALADERVDVLVIGGGITGVGVALDAATRGLSVALVERGDLAQGTSRWSSKLVHGGLRYLASGNVRLAYESAVERRILIDRTAPHLVRALPMLIPLHCAVSAGHAAVIRAGMHAGDVLRAVAGTRRTSLPRPRRLGAAETLQLGPAINPAGLRGGLLGWDGQLVDDARLVVAVARTAAGFGARILTRCTARRVDGDGARIRDALTGADVDVRARVVINATGVWAGRLAPEIALRPSRGTHLVVPVARFAGLPAALTVPLTGERNRFALALPAGDGRAYVGLTDEPVDELPDGDPSPAEHEVASLLRAFDGVLTTPLQPDDVLGAFAGLRPLLASPGPADGPTSSGTADLSRRHLIHHGHDGLVTVVGGKLTTYRQMAEEAVDAAARDARLPAGPCRTTRLPLVGAAPPALLARVAAPARLVARYGTEATRVLAEAGDDPRAAEPVAPGVAVTPAELAFAVRHEGALDIDDLLDRRTRIGLVAADRAVALPAAERALSEAGRQKA